MNRRDKTRAWLMGPGDIFTQIWYVKIGLMDYCFKCGMVGWPGSRNRSEAEFPDEARRAGWIPCKCACACECRVVAGQHSKSI